MDLKKLTIDGHCPFDESMGRIRDPRARSAVLVRMERMRENNPGDHKSVGGGVMELRIPVGAGWRVYYGLRDGAWVVLMLVGDKSTQRRDIGRVVQWWRSFNEQEDGFGTV